MDRCVWASCPNCGEELHEMESQRDRALSALRKWREAEELDEGESRIVEEREEACRLYAEARAERDEVLDEQS